LLCLQLVSKPLKKLIDDEKVWCRFVASEFGPIFAKPSSWKKFFLNEAVKYINEKLEFFEIERTTEVSIDKKSISGVDGHVQSFVLGAMKLKPPLRYYWEVQVTSYSSSHLTAIGISPHVSPHSNVIGCDNNYSFFYGDCYGLTYGSLYRGRKTKFGRPIQTGDTIGILVDLKAMKLTVFINGENLGVAFEQLEEQQYCPAFSIQGNMKITIAPKPTPSMRELMVPMSSS